MYTPDIVLPNMLYAAVLRSPHAHARIESISTEEASGIPGVHAVITAADFPGVKYVHLGAKWSDRYPMAGDRVRFFGEEVAAVAAESMDLARAAATRIEVAYALLPAALDPEAAMRPDALAVHDGELTRAGKNIAQRISTDFGDVESAFARATQIFEDEFEHGVVVPGCMETNGTVADYDAESGVLTLWTATQAP
ncbi:MAG: molybdopterin-dependent oxidoreductase, partial [Gammaproteobacteria bacterium]|nr:molybdopterin-dependent oxidoreductase [Gammaproteobacteria bacterium]